jgi:uncharacterized protein YqeY
MKAKCINNKNNEDRLIVGKFYDVIDYDVLFYEIENTELKFSKFRFITLSKIRNEKIDKLLKYNKMELKNKIQADFLVAMKNGDNVSKLALSSIKAKITEAEKANSNNEISDDEIVKIINKAIKQREESEKIYMDSGRTSLANNEKEEANILRKYMPTQMSISEIKIAIQDIINTNELPIGNFKAMTGKVIGLFNKKYQGRADIETVRTIVIDMFK